MQANTFACDGRDYGSGPIRYARMCILGIILLALISSTAVAASKVISSIDVSNKPDTVVITVQGTAPLRVTPMLASRYLGFQFAGRFIGKGRLVGIRSGKIFCVRYSRYCNNPPITRIVINASACPAYSTRWNDDRSQLIISVQKFGSRAVARPAVGPQTEAAAAVIPYMPVLPPAEIAGPQGSDPGTPDAPVTSGILVASAGPEAFEAAVGTRPAAQPMQAARPASSVPVGVPEVVETPPATVASAASATPEVSAKPAPAVKTISPAAPAPVRVAQAIVVPSEPVAKKVSLNFLGADINDVLKALAAQTGANIVASKDVKGEVTVSLTDVTLDQALDYVTKLSGFGYSKVDGTYLVAPKNSLQLLSGTDAPAAASTEVVQVRFSNCDDLLALVKSRYPEVDAAKVGGQGAGKESGAGSVVLTGPAASLAEAKALIEQIDSPGGTDQYVYRVKYVAPDKLAEALRKLLPNVNVEGLGITAGGNGRAGGGVSGASAGGGGDSGGGVGAEINAIRMSGSDQMTEFKQQSPMNLASTDSLSRTLIITGGRAVVAKAKALVEALDIKAPLIKVEAKITSITETGEKKIGLNWNWGDLVVMEDSAAPTIINDDAYATPVAVSKNITVDRALGRWFRQPLGFGATLDALIKDGNGKLLASPNLLCLEGRPCQFFVGDQIRYVVLVQQTPQGNNVQTEQANVGVQLTVVGSASPDGFITLNLHPEVSVVRLNEDKQAGITLPTITRRFTDHVVRVKDGQTIAIGGLINDSDLVTLSKLPLLGDIPFLGQLFRHKERTKDHSEVVIFITASVVKD